jgi:hypothetical protein
MSCSEWVGELASGDEALDASEVIDSSLIFVWSGKNALAGRRSPCSSDSSACCSDTALVTIVPVDFEKGDSSIGVTLIRDEGESKDCDRMRTFGEGVRGVAIPLAILR